MIKSTTATSPAGRHETCGGSPNRFLPPRGGTLREAIDTLEIQVARLEDWSRRFGQDHDRAHLVDLAIEHLKIQVQTLKGVGDDTRPLFGADHADDRPLLKLGQGAYAREVRGDPRTGALNVQG